MPFIYQSESPISRRQLSPNAHSSGVALIVVLFAVALVSIVVLAYFNLAMMNRNISFSSAGELRANMLALSSLNYIKADFISEIQNGSVLETDPTSSGLPIYLPNTNTTMLPYRMTTNITLDVTIPPNLVKWSSGTIPIWTNTTAYGGQYGPIRASTVSTTTPSVNGHYLASTLWTRPVFGTNATFPSAVVPQWVYMSRQGPVVTGTTGLTTTMKNPDASNASFIVGRYAYTVYDEGGLLDVNAAGYSPSASSPTMFGSTDGTDVGRKGNQGFADLTQVGLTSGQIDQVAAGVRSGLVGWRNPTSATSVSSYVGYLTTNAPTSGFMNVTSGDRTFVGRQDLILYWFSELNGTTNSLTYLTTFSREKNAPSWGPEHNAYDSSSGVANYWKGMTTNTYDPSNTTKFISYSYRDNQDSTTAPSNPSQSIYNRFLPNVRVPATGVTRLSGEAAVVGEPLVKNRFDLNKLAWITYNGSLPSGITAADILHYFGLTRNATDGSWTYNHGNSARILRLDEVAAAGREPDLFELMQAVILQGGLGLCLGDPMQTGSATGGEFARQAQGASSQLWPCPLYRYDSAGKIVYAQEMYQVAQLVANMIDQYDADNYPTEIVLNGEHFYGIENLPYINSFADTTLRPAPSSIQAPTAGTVDANSNFQAYVHRWLTFALWNPHQNAAFPSATGPSNFRIFVSAGNEYPTVHNLPGYELTPTAGYDYSGRIFEPPSTTTIKSSSYGANTDGPSWIGFKLSDYPNFFAEPTALAYASTYTTPATAGVTINMNDPDGRIATKLGWQRAGVYMGWSLDPDWTNKVSMSSNLWSAPQTPVAHFTNPPVALGNTPNELKWFANASTNTTAELIGLTVYLQFQDTTGTWHTYEELRGMVHSRDGQGDAYMEPLDPEWTKWTAATKSAVGYSTGPFPPLAAYQDSYVLTFLDPRAPRLGPGSLRSGSSNVMNLTNTWAVASGIGTAGPTGPHYIGSSFAGTNLVNNLNTNTTYYTDRDFVTRVGDGSGWASSSPLSLGALQQRPLHLDRPFRSVAELGYVFRDDPWKSLNLISANSADSALLDLFYIGARATAPSNLPPPNVIAGKININSAAMNSTYANSKGSLPLQALLSKGLRYYSPSNPSIIAPDVTTNSITATEAATLATNIVTYAQTNSLMNVSDIPALFPQAPQNPATPTGNPGIKQAREALVRSLADSVDTRTWNLMIDVVAQAGRFSPAATSLNNFTVDGEKHYWLHVAIDRFTGEIIDQQLEPVWE